MTDEEREMLAEMLPACAAVIEWHWIDTDGPPPDDGRYLVAIINAIDVPTVCEGYWNLGTWWCPDAESKMLPPLAWAELPAFPTRGQHESDR